MRTDNTEASATAGSQMPFRGGKLVHDPLQFVPHFLPPPLLPSQQGHLNQVREHDVGSPRLQGQGLVGQPLRFLEGAVQECQQRSHRRGCPPMDGNGQLLGQPGVGHDVGLDRLSIARFERGGRPTGITVQFHLTVAGLLCQTKDLCGHGSAFIQPVRTPHRHPPGIERGAQCRRVCQPTGHGDRFETERLETLRLVREGEFQRQAGQQPCAKG
jgi:hypothetical protein